MNTDRFLSVFIGVHLWFRSYFWLRLGCTVEFVANKTDHEFHEFYENDLESLELDYLAQPRECCNQQGEGLALDILRSGDGIRSRNGSVHFCPFILTSGF